MPPEPFNPEGWCYGWRYLLKQDPNLESLHDEPEFQIMVIKLKADMAAQLESLREMERDGELESMPGFPTAEN